MTRKEEQVETGNRMEESRRKFLKTAGKIAVYTPPAMLIVSQPSFAEIQTSGGSGSYQDLSLNRQSLDCFNAAGPETKGIVRRFCRIL